jgi:hypothetical protein
MTATWWAISSEEFRDALVRAHGGEDPDLLLTEIYANSDHEDIEGNHHD